MANIRKELKKMQYWQTADRNVERVIQYRDHIMRLAMNRFRYVNMPKTCDAYYLEKTLLLKGQSTIFLHPELDVWLNASCTMGNPNMYDEPTTWRAITANGWDFEVTPSNGVIVWDNSLKVPIWNDIDLWSQRLADLDMAIDMNIKHQNVPWVFTAPQEKIIDVTNVVKQAFGGEPAIIGYKSLDSIKADLLATPVELKVEQLMNAKLMVYNEIYTKLGIDNLPKKSERMIEDEVNANNDPTDLMALDCLEMRRRALDYLNDTFGTDIKVYWRQDYESDTFNYEHNAMLQEEGETNE